MNLDKIVFVLENCDTIEVPGKYVGDMSAYDLKTSIARVACNAFDEMVTCESFYIEIHRDAERTRYPFNDPQFQEPHSLFERLSDGDITSVQLVMNGTKKEFFVQWSPEDEYRNSWQDSRISKCGHLYITISEKSIFDEVFPAAEIDDPEMVYFHMEMLNVGDAYQEG